MLFNVGPCPLLSSSWTSTSLLQEDLQQLLPIIPYRLVCNNNNMTSTAPCIYRWTGRYEAHLWDSTVERVRVNNKGRKRGKQVLMLYKSAILCIVVQES